MEWYWILLIGIVIGIILVWLVATWKLSKWWKGL